jgi:hypothetical protein
MSEREAPSAASPAPAEPPLEWSVDPWREFPLRAVTGFLAAVALGLLAVRLSPVPLAGWALALALLAILAPAYLPVRCRVDAAGIARRLGFGWERRAWSDIRVARLTAGGLYVSTLAHGGPLEPFRGLLLPLPRRRLPELRPTLAAVIEAHGV